MQRYGEAEKKGGAKGGRERDGLVRAVTTEYTKEKG